MKTNRFCFVALVKLAALSLASSSAQAQDDKVGTGISITIDNSPIEADIEGYDVYQDANGNYYAKKGDHVIKLQKGDKVKYKDTDGNEQTKEQAQDNADGAFNKLHDVKSDYFASLAPSEASVGDLFYALDAPSDIAAELRALNPGAFGERDVDAFGFFGIQLEPGEVFFLASSTADGDTPSFVTLAAGSLWLDFSFDAVIGKITAKIVGAAYDASVFSGTNHVMLTGTVVPEPSALGLALIGMACAGAAVRKGWARTVCVKGPSQRAGLHEAASPSRRR